MTARDQRILKIGGLFAVAYLLAFYGFQFWRKGQKSQSDYQQLARKAQQMQQDFWEQQKKVLLYDKLSEAYHLDPRRISKDTLVADASAAIQNAAQQSGMRLGPFRETPGRQNARELSTIVIEGNGPITAALTLLHKIQTLGYPLIIDSIQLTQGGGQSGGGRGGPPGMPPGMMPGMPMGMGGGGPPGQLKINLTVIILNYEQWKEAPRA